MYRRAGVHYVITKFSCFDRLPINLSNGVTPRALRARGSSAFKLFIYHSITTVCKKTFLSYLKVNEIIIIIIIIIIINNYYYYHYCCSYSNGSSLQIKYYFNDSRHVTHALNFNLGKTSATSAPTEQPSVSGNIFHF